MSGMAHQAQGLRGLLAEQSYPRANINNLASGLVTENEWLTDYELSDLAMLLVVNLIVEEAASSRKANIGVEDPFIHLNRRAPSQSL